MESSKGWTWAVSIVPWVLLPLLQPALVTAQTPYLVQDAATGNGSGPGLLPNLFTPAGGIVYFRGDDAAHGFELWRTDGTQAGTALVRDIYPGPAGASPEELTALGPVLYFVALHGLWRSDGTPEGTTPVPFPATDPQELTVAGGMLYFTAEEGQHGRELWRSDGTTAGTLLVDDIWPGPIGSYPLGLAEMGGCVFFATITENEGDELWVSDGTMAGTALVKDIYPGIDFSSPMHLVDAQGTLFFVANDGAHGFELWKSDGTTAGTTLVRDIKPGMLGSGFDEIAAVGSRVFLKADDGVHGAELWTSDGTEEGTILTRDINPDPAASPGPVRLTAFGGALFFVADDGINGYELWKSDGTTAGTQMVAITSAGAAAYDGPWGLTAVGTALFFSADDGIHGRELWRTDGTAAGTTMFDLGPGAVASIPDSLADVGGVLFFSAAPAGDYHSQPWRSDGTAAGTYQFASLNTAASSDPSLMIELNGEILYMADDGVHGLEIWRSDGTEAGTALLKEIRPGPDGILWLNPTLFEGAVYFGDNDGSGGGLWRTDGTEAGTVLVKRFDIGPYGYGMGALVALGDVLYLEALDTARGVELWKSDGTEAGTVFVKDIQPGPGNGSPTEFLASGGTLLFQADDGVHGNELWKTDGTEAGTVLVKDIFPGSTDGVPNSGFPGSLTAGPGGGIFFRARDSQGSELWKTDGSEAGTVLVKDIFIGPLSGSPSDLTAAGERLFFTAFNVVNGYELWQSDGTTAGTTPLDIRPGPASSIPTGLVELQGSLYFVADDGLAGRELWTSNGTLPGTTRVKDISPGTESAFVLDHVIARAGGRLFFAAFTPATGLELWTSDGAEAGTHALGEIGPGSASSGIDPFSLPIAAGQRLFFTAADATHGRELWALPPPTLSVADLAVSESAPAATFTATLSWPGLAPIALDYATSDGTARAGADYAAASGTLTLPAGATSTPISVPLLGDALDEDDETFSLAVTAGPEALEATATILDDDPEPGLAVADAAVTEGDAGSTPAAVDVTLSAPSGRTVTVAYATSDGTASVGSDYLGASGALTFAPGTTAQTLSVSVLGDVLDEPHERFFLDLSGPEAAVLDDPFGMITILDDDGGPVPLAELIHGTTRLEDLAGSGGADLFLLPLDPRASFEVVLDGVHGDLGPDGPALEWLAPDLVTVLGEGTPSGASTSRSLRLENPAPEPGLAYVRVRSLGCDTACSPRDGYRLRARETTLSSARFNNSGTQASRLVLQNAAAEPVNGHVTLLDGSGAGLASVPVSLPPRGSLVLALDAIAPGSAGSVRTSHDGGGGNLMGKVVSVEAATGLVFETPLLARR